MTLFDIAAGLMLIVSGLAGWFRGGMRELAWVAAFVLSAVIAIFALRFSGPIARHAVHPVWLANIAAILIVFAGAYILLRVIAASFTRSIRQTPLGGLDRLAGVGFGLVRGLAVLGLAYLTINAITPPERMPPWISGARLYPLSEASARTLKAFAPQGARLASQMAPVIDHAVSEGNSAGDAENRDYNDPPPRSPGVRVERSR